MRLVLEMNTAVLNTQHWKRLTSPMPAKLIGCQANQLPSKLVKLGCLMKSFDFEKSNVCFVLFHRTVPFCLVKGFSRFAKGNACCYEVPCGIQSSTTSAKVNCCGGYFFIIATSTRWLWVFPWHFQKLSEMMFPETEFLVLGFLCSPPK